MRLFEIHWPTSAGRGTLCTYETRSTRQGTGSADGQGWPSGRLVELVRAVRALFQDRLAEEIGMCPHTGENQGFDLFFPLEYEKPVRLDMAFLKVHPVAGEAMKLALGSQGNTSQKILDNFLEALHRIAPLGAELVILLELVCVVRTVHQSASSAANRDAAVLCLPGF